MSTNRGAKQELERMFGKGCMFRNFNIEKELSQLHPTITSYRIYLKQTRYTGKQINQLERNMTYHHLRHRSEGGKTTLDNGAVLSELVHRYVHWLPRREEEIINNLIRQKKFEFKAGILIPTEKGIDIRDPIQIELELNEEDGFIEIPVYNTTEQDMQKRKKFNRAKEKKNAQQLIDEEMEWLYSDQDDGFDR